MQQTNLPFKPTTHFPQAPTANKLLTPRAPTQCPSQLIITITPMTDYLRTSERGYPNRPRSRRRQAPSDQYQEDKWAKADSETSTNISAVNQEMSGIFTPDGHGSQQNNRESQRNYHETYGHTRGQRAAQGRHYNEFENYNKGYAQSRRGRPDRDLEGHRTARRDGLSRDRFQQRDTSQRRRGEAYRSGSRVREQSYGSRRQREAPISNRRKRRDVAKEVRWEEASDVYGEPPSLTSSETQWESSRHYGSGRDIEMQGNGYNRHNDDTNRNRNHSYKREKEAYRNHHEYQYQQEPRKKQYRGSMNRQIRERSNNPRQRSRNLHIGKDEYASKQNRQNGRHSSEISPSYRSKIDYQGQRRDEQMANTKYHTNPHTDEYGVNYPPKRNISKNKRREKLNPRQRRMLGYEGPNSLGGYNQEDSFNDPYMSSQHDSMHWKDDYKQYQDESQQSREFDDYEYENHPQAKQFKKHQSRYNTQHIGKNKNRWYKPDSNRNIDDSRQETRKNSGQSGGSQNQGNRRGEISKNSIYTFGDGSMQETNRFFSFNKKPEKRGNGFLNRRENRNVIKKKYQIKESAKGQNGTDLTREQRGSFEAGQHLNLHQNNKNRPLKIENVKKNSHRQASGKDTKLAQSLLQSSESGNKNGNFLQIPAGPNSNIMLSPQHLQMSGFSKGQKINLANSNFINSPRNGIKLNTQNGAIMNPNDYQKNDSLINQNLAERNRNSKMGIPPNANLITLNGKNLTPGAIGPNGQRPNLNSPHHRSSQNSRRSTQNQLTNTKFDSHTTNPNLSPHNPNKSQQNRLSTDPLILACKQNAPHLQRKHSSTTRDTTAPVNIILTPQTGFSNQNSTQQSPSMRSPKALASPRKTFTSQNSQASNRLSKMTSSLKGSLQQNFNSSLQMKTSTGNARAMQIKYVNKAGLHKGKIKIGQDAVLINKFSVEGQIIHIFGIFDGHGKFGHYVSQFAKKQMSLALSHFAKQKGLKVGIEKILHRAILYVNQQILKKHQAYCKLHPQRPSKDFEIPVLNALSADQFNASLSGSTCLVSVLFKNKLYTASLGDSKGVIGQSHSQNMMGGNFMMSPAPAARKMVAIEVSIEHKASCPREKARVRSFGGSVRPYMNQDFEEMGPDRIWNKEGKHPGLMVSRSFGDLVGKDCGVSGEAGMFNNRLTGGDFGQLVNIFAGFRYFKLFGILENRAF